MRHLFIGRLLAILATAAFTASCGGGSKPDPNTTPVIPKSNIAKRAFVTNTFFGAVQIVDAANDASSQFTVVKTDGATPVFSSLTQLLTTTTKTFLLDSGNNSIYAVDNSNEQLVAGATFGGTISSFIATPDAKFIYAAVPGASKVQWVDLSVTSPTVTDIALAGVRRLVVTGDGTKVLAFGDDASNIRVIKVSDNSVTTIGGFDRPYTAVISTDNTKAYVLSCGAQCGGTQAKVTVVDLATNTAGASVNVGGATVGVIEGTTLYVAGSPGVSSSATNGGTLDVINLSTFTRTSGVNISDGLHEQIAVASNSKLYIGARACTQTGSKGCLSIYNISAGTASLGAPLGNVTAVTPISGRSVVYTVQGGNLYIYNTSTDTLQAKQFDFTGHITDVKEIK